LAYDFSKVSADSGQDVQHPEPEKEGQRERGGVNLEKKKKNLGGRTTAINGLVHEGAWVRKGLFQPKYRNLEGQSLK